jgi:hypothetical protein
VILAISDLPLSSYPFSPFVTRNKKKGGFAGDIFTWGGEQIPAIPPQIPHKKSNFNPTNQKKKKGKLGA